MAAVYNAAGVVGLKLWKFIFTALTVLFIADSEASTGAPPSVQLPVLLVASVGLILQTQFRPQMFTLVCLSALIALLARDNYRRGPTIWLAVPLMALWATRTAALLRESQRSRSIAASPRCAISLRAKACAARSGSPW